MIEEDEYIGTTTPEEDDLCDGEIWRLHTGLNARVTYEISAEKLRKLKF
jgi:hypothetical protein